MDCFFVWKLTLWGGWPATNQKSFVENLECGSKNLLFGIGSFGGGRWLCPLKMLILLFAHACNLHSASVPSCLLCFAVLLSEWVLSCRWARARHGHAPRSRSRFSIDARCELTARCGARPSPTWLLALLPFFPIHYLWLVYYLKVKRTETERRQLANRQVARPQPASRTMWKCKISKAQNVHNVSHINNSTYLLLSFSFSLSSSMLTQNQSNHLIHNLTRLRNEFIWFIWFIVSDQKVLNNGSKIASPDCWRRQTPFIRVPHCDRAMAQNCGGHCWPAAPILQQNSRRPWRGFLFFNLNKNPLKNRRKPGRTWTQWSQNCPKCATSSWLTNRWKNSRQKVRRMLPFGMGKFKSRARFGFEF